MSRLTVRKPLQMFSAPAVSLLQIEPTALPHVQSKIHRVSRSSWDVERIKYFLLPNPYNFKGKKAKHKCLRKSLTFLKWYCYLPSASYQYLFLLNHLVHLHMQHSAVPTHRKHDWVASIPCTSLCKATKPAIYVDGSPSHVCIIFPKRCRSWIQESL